MLDFTQESGLVKALDYWNGSSVSNYDVNATEEEKEIRLAQAKSQFKVYLPDKIGNIADSKSLFKLEKTKNNAFGDWTSEALTERQKNNCKQITVAVAIKNRTEAFKNSIKTWMKFPFKKFIILDCQSDMHIGLEIGDIIEGDDRWEIFRINEGFEKYNHSRARNIKCGLVENPDDWILCIDSEIMLCSDFLDEIFRLDPSFYYLTDPKCVFDGLAGTAIFQKKIFLEVGGFNENTNGRWGFEDIHFYEQVRGTGLWNEAVIDSYSLYHQPHSDELRTKYSDVKNKWQANAMNKFIDFEQKIFKRNFKIYNTAGNLRIIEPEEDLYNGRIKEYAAETTMRP